MYRILWLLLALLAGNGYTQNLKLVKKIGGSIAPKSIVHNGNGLFFAQNMMYRHSITVYNRDFQLVKTISDKVNLADYNISGYTGQHAGAPVECAFSPDGRYAWITNYAMEGSGFDTPGDDDCLKDPKEWDYSFIYKINTSTFQIENVVQVGSVPKYAAATPDGRYVLVSNWCSSDLSVIDAATNRELKRIPLGRYPRGIAVDPQSKRAYVCLMGSNKITAINFSDWNMWQIEVGNGPRHICLSPDGRYAYITLNLADQLVKVDLWTGAIIAKTNAGDAPRSMCTDGSGQFLYVVHYKDNTLGKYRTDDLTLIESAKTAGKPIGVTYDIARQTVWVACYTGMIWVFSDQNGPALPQPAVASSAPASTPEPTSVVPRATPRKEPTPAQTPRPTTGASTQSAQNQTPAPTKPAPAPTKTSPQPSAPVATPAKPQTPPKPQTTTPAKPTPTKPAALPYTIVVGSFSSSANAANLQKQLKAKGLAAQIRGNRVCVGAYATEAEANKAAQTLAAKHNLKGCWVLKTK